MSEADDKLLLQIKKYPNRRYYDATRSRHITLQEVYDVVREGHHVCVTDSRTGDDITNVVLLQIILDKDQPKLDLFPPTVLHMIIRSQRQALRTTLERVFGPMMEMMASSQKQVDGFLRQTTAGGLQNPMDWAGQMMTAFSPHSPEPQRDDHDPSEPPPEEAQGRADEVDELRRQVEAMSRRIEELSSRGSGGST